MAAVATILCGGAVAGHQRFRRRAAPSLHARGGSASDGAHLVCGRKLRPALFPASSFGTVSLSSPGSRKLLRTSASAASSDSQGLVSLGSCLPAAPGLLHYRVNSTFYPLVVLETSCSDALIVHTERFNNKDYI